MTRPQPIWRGEARQLPSVLEELLQDARGLLLLESIDAVDHPGDGVITLYYVFHDLDAGRELVLEALVDREARRAPSVADLVPAAASYEKEIYDLMGVVFEGNPGLREGFLKPPGMEGTYPLLRRAPER